jgi:hypothetical protein
MHVPPDPERLDESKPAIEFLPPIAPPATTKDNASADDPARQTAEEILQRLPNDLTRMIYLASLRDCNSGMYLHPELSYQQGIQKADRALRSCHERIFRRLLATRVADYVTQLQEYIRYTRGETDTVLKTWKSLQAYRATVPTAALALSSEMFFLNVSMALEILSTPQPEARGT